MEYAASRQTAHSHIQAICKTFALSPLCHTVLGLVKTLSLITFSKINKFSNAFYGGLVWCRKDHLRLIFLYDEIPVCY